MESSEPRNKALSVIAQGGLIAGVLDITDAFVFFGSRGVPPIRILQSVASGLLGLASFKGGWNTAALGLGLHFFIATSAAAVYYASSRKFAVLRRRPVVCGLLYGAGVYCVMNYVVIPLSAVAKNPKPPTTVSLVNAVLAIVLLVGLPIALIVAKNDQKYAGLGKLNLSNHQIG